MLASLFFFPDATLQSVSDMLDADSQIKYSSLKNIGTINRPKLVFQDFSFIKNEVTIASSSELIIELKINSDFLFRTQIESLSIAEGFVSLGSLVSSEEPLRQIYFNPAGSLAFNDFSILQQNSKITLNGNINGLNTHLRILHGNNVSTVAVSSDDQGLAFMLNIQPHNWLAFFPGMDLPAGLTDNTELFISVLGTLQDHRINATGSLGHSEFIYGNLSIQPNQGSFSLVSNRSSAALGFHKLLHPFIDLNSFIVIDFKKQYLTIPLLNITDTYISFKNKIIERLSISNLLVSVHEKEANYSGMFYNLDLQNLYFEKIHNLSGGFQGRGQDLNFDVSSGEVLFGGIEDGLNKAQIFGSGFLNGSKFSLHSRLIDVNGAINFQLEQEFIESKNLKLLVDGTNISKQLITSSIPSNFTEVKFYLEDNLKSIGKNSIYLNFQNNAKKNSPHFELKFSVTDAHLTYSPELSYSFDLGLLEIKNNHLFISAEKTKFNNMPIKNIYANFNFADNHIDYLTRQLTAAADIPPQLRDIYRNLSDKNLPILSKGRFELETKNFFNTIRVKTPAFAYQLDGPIDIEIDVENGQIFVMNFESLFGTASAHSLDKSFDLFLHGHHLQSDFKLSLKTNIALQVSKVLPQVKFLPFKGEGSFDFTLIKSKGSELSLTIDSDLLGVGWQSPLKNINKSQHETLPTKIYVSDFNNPNIFMSNELFKSQISWLPKNGILATLKASQLDIRLQQDASKFIRIDVINSQLAAGLGSKINKDSKPLLARIKILPPINARFTLKNSTLDNLKFKDLDIYIQKNKNTLRLDNIMVDSNLINIQAPSSSSKAYLAIDLKKDLYKAHGKFTFKDSIEIPWIRDIAKFSYFNSDLSLQWNNLKTIKNLEGGARFLIKDLTVEGSSPSSAVLNLLGVLNLKNIIGKLANLELSLDEYTSTHLDRVEGNLLFTKDRGRLLEPLFVETNAAKMKWAGQINKNRFGQLEDLDLNLDLRIRLNENIPLYAVLLGGLPAVAGSAVIQEIFKEDLDALSSYQFQVKGTIKQPEFSRIN